MKNILELDKILNSIQETIFRPDFYWQLLAIASCLLLTFAFYKITKRLLHLKIKHDPGFDGSNLHKMLVKYISPLFLPILAIVILAIGLAIFSKYYVYNLIFSSLIQLIALLIFLRFIKIFFGNNFIANLVAMFLVPAIILSIFGFLDPTIKYLDSLAFTMGSVRISIFTVIKASLTLLIVFWLSGLISRKSKAYIKNHSQIQPSTRGVISKIIDITLYFIVFVVLLRVFGVNTTTFAVVGGAIGVGIGFGLQKIASNFIGGIILLFEKSVEIGDLIEIDNELTGTITNFGGRYTLLETFDGKEVMVPNEDLIINKVTNLTYNNNRGRLDIEVRISYDSDVDKAQEIMINIAKEHPRCLLYPSPEAYIMELNESSIDLIMHFWINNVSDGRMRPRSDIFSEILKQFRKNKITIPFPQRDINFNKAVPIKK